MHNRPRSKPEWWPENEPWPPANWRGSWGRGRPPRGWWIFGLGFVLMALLACIGGTALFWLIASGVGSITQPMPFFFARALSGAALIIGLLGIVFVVRTFRAAAGPINDLMDAAAHVEAGDFSARVRVRGPREVRQLANAFNAMAERLQTNEETRRNLLADVTHELRTPLTIIQGNIEGVLDGLYPRDDAHLAPVLEETRVMSRLIEDLRTLSLVESGSLQLQREPTDLGALVMDVLASFQAQADAAGVTLASNIEDGVPMLEVDPLRIRAVLNNLLTNALRYTSSGGTVTMSAMAEDQHVRVAVSDTGRGIAPDALPHIFDRFYKGRDSLGTGLGLAIAKQLVQAHGGQIYADSEVGRGATIAFTLPTRTSNTQKTR
jgi:signal transduction histidine kinase